MTSDDWKKAWRDAMYAGATLHSGQWSKLVAEARAEANADNDELYNAGRSRLLGVEPENLPWRRPKVVPPNYVPVPANTLLGIEARLAEVERRLSWLDEIGAVEWAIKQRAGAAAVAIERCLKGRGDP